MIIPHIRDIFICGILGHYHKWLIKPSKTAKKVLTCQQKNDRFIEYAAQRGLQVLLTIYGADT